MWFSVTTFQYLSFYLLLIVQLPKFFVCLFVCFAEVNHMINFQFVLV